MASHTSSKEEKEMESFANAFIHGWNRFCHIHNKEPRLKVAKYIAKAVFHESLMQLGFTLILRNGTEYEGVTYPDECFNSFENTEYVRFKVKYLLQILPTSSNNLTVPYSFDFLLQRQPPQKLAASAVTIQMNDVCSAKNNIVQLAKQIYSHIKTQKSIDDSDHTDDGDHTDEETIRCL